MIHPDLSRLCKLVYCTVFVMKVEDETILNDRGKFLCMRRVSERSMEVVTLSISLKNIRNTCLRNGKKELYRINLDASRFLAQNVLSRATCLSRVPKWLSCAQACLVRITHPSGYKTY